jgi:hypothetical protein
MSRYSTHPIEQEFQKWDREQRHRRDQYWNALFLMRNDYMEDNKGVLDPTVRPTLHYYAELKYGFKMGLDSQGNYTKDHEVVDPKKYLLFQIKYMR